MTDQIPNPITNNIPPPPAPMPVEVAPKAPTDWKLLLSKVKPTLIELFGKFYSNKKIFRLVSVVFGLILLIIILGILVGKRSAGQNTTTKTSPSPAVQNTPGASPSSDVLTNNQIKLNDLKKQINNLDVKESRLKPPTLNFDIRF
jgi:hypothetical protein